MHVVSNCCLRVDLDAQLACKGGPACDPLFPCLSITVFQLKTKTSPVLQATTGQVVGMSSSQNAIQMTSLPSAHHHRDSAPPSYCQPACTQDAPSMNTQPAYSQSVPSMQGQPAFLQRAPGMQSQPAFPQYARHSYREQGDTGTGRRGSKAKGQGSYVPAGHLSAGVPSSHLNITVPNCNRS